MMTFYLSGTVAYGLFLLLCKFSDRECSKTDLVSWLVIAIASTFWIVVIPISLLEVRSKSKARSRLANQKGIEGSSEATSYLETTISIS